MARPNPEEIFSAYTEVYTTNAGTNSHPRSSRSYTRSYSSVNDPNFPRSRQWHPHSMYKQWGSRTASISLYEYWVGRPDLGWGSHQIGFVGAAPNLSMLDTVTHDTDLLYRCNNAHMDEISDRKVNLAQAFAERAQTVRLIQDTAFKLASAIRHVKKGNLSLAARALGVRLREKKKTGQTVAQQWLALQYGWKPLLSDVRGAAELLAQRHYSRPPRLVVLTKRQSSTPVKQTGTFYSSYSVPAYLEGIRTSRVRQESVYEVSNQFIRDGGQTGIIDPLTIAWELTPWSFVVDWFIPIGNFVARLNYDAGLSFVSRLQTQYSSFEGKAFPKGSHGNPGPYGTLMRNSSGSFDSHAVKVDRVLAGALRPDLPRFKDPFSTLHCLNAIALMATSFKGNPRKIV